METYKKDRLSLAIEKCPFCGSREIENIYAGKFWWEYRCKNPVHDTLTFGKGDMQKEKEYMKDML